MAGFPELSAVLFDQQLSVEDYEQQLYGDGRHLFSNRSCIQRMRNKGSACVLTGQAERLMYAGFIGCVLYQIIRIRNSKLNLSRTQLKRAHISNIVLSTTSAVVAYGVLHYISGGSQAMQETLKNSLIDSLKETRASLADMIEGFKNSCALLDELDNPSQFAQTLKDNAPSLKWAKTWIDKTPDINQRYAAFNAVLRHVGIDPLPEDGLEILITAANKV